MKILEVSVDDEDEVFAELQLNFHQENACKNSRI